MIYFFKFLFEKFPKCYIEILGWDITREREMHGTNTWFFIYTYASFSKIKITLTTFALISKIIVILSKSGIIEDSSWVNITFICWKTWSDSIPLSDHGCKCMIIYPEKKNKNEYWLMLDSKAMNIPLSNLSRLFATNALVSRCNIYQLYSLIFPWWFVFCRISLKIIVILF